MTYSILQDLLSGEDVRLIAPLTVDEDPVDVRRADGLNLARIEVAFKFDQNPETLRQIRLLDHAGVWTLKKKKIVEFGLKFNYTSSFYFICLTCNLLFMTPSWSN